MFLSRAVPGILPHPAARPEQPQGTRCPFTRKAFTQTVRAADGQLSRVALAVVPVAARERKAVASE
jgi:hypothetical protein